jgi:FlaG/FlaF family flagellin (archaellin)
MEENMIKKRRRNHAVSEVLATVLLLGITIGLFGFLNYIVFSFSFEPSAPSVSLIGSIDREHSNITIEHNGGKSLDGTTRIIITIGNKTYTKSASELLSKPTWDFTDTVHFHYLDNITNRYVQAVVMDPTTNTLILSVVLQQGLTISGGGIIWNNHPVDSASSNVDASDDFGTESNFGFVQGTIPDGNVMTIQESDYGNQQHKDDVDSSLSDIDSSPDKGIETNFTNAQGTTPDINVMTLTEETSGLSSIDEHLFVDGITNSSTGWTFVGPTPALNSIGSGYISTSSDNTVRRWFTFMNTTSTGDNLAVSMSIYVNTGDGDDDVQWGIDTNGDNTAEYSGIIANPMGSKWYTTGTLNGLTTGALVNSSRVSFTYLKSGQAKTIMIDAAQLNVTRVSSINNQIDFEYQWTTAHFSDSTKRACFYVASHPIGTEALNVYYRNGTTWTSLGTLTTTGWTNFSAVGLNSQIYTLRLLGASESSDTTQDTWNIDCLFLDTYNSSNNRIELEYQWINAQYNEQGKTICMYVTSHNGGSEALNVNYWNGANWINLGTVTANGWRNLTATGLNSPTYTIQLKGAIETDDSVQDSWTIDCMFLQTYSFT